jgi:hypothetical protein
MKNVNFLLSFCRFPAGEADKRLDKRLLKVKGDRHEHDQ